jgi:hypothetical protein
MKNINVSIYTTGAFLYPVKIKDAEGNEKWIWAVSSFEDDSYTDGILCNPITTADTKEGLLTEDPDDE